MHRLVLHLIPVERHWRASVCETDTKILLDRGLQIFKTSHFHFLSVPVYLIHFIPTFAWDLHNQTLEPLLNVEHIQKLTLSYVYQRYAPWNSSFVLTHHGNLFNMAKFSPETFGSISHWPWEIPYISDMILVNAESHFTELHEDPGIALMIMSAGLRSFGYCNCSKMPYPNNKSSSAF